MYSEFSILGAPLPCLAVVPVLVGPLQVLLAILPGLFLALGGLLLSLFRPRAIWQAINIAWKVKYSLLSLALLFGILYGLMRSIWPVGAVVITEAEATMDSWTTFRGSLGRRGWVSSNPEPTRPALIWNHRRANEAFFSSPAVLGNRVYIASAEMSAFSQKGAIYCFDADSGAEVWRTIPPDYRPTFSSPVISGNYLVCGEGVHDTHAARVVCLDISEQGRGRLLWTYATKSHVECTPVIDRGRVYVGAGDDGYYCLHLEPQSSNEAQLIWHRPAEENPDAETSLAVHEGKVYAGLGLGGRKLRVMNSETGELLREIETPYPVFSPPSFSKKGIIFGMGNGDYVHSAAESAEIQIAAMQKRGSSPEEIAAARAQLAPAGEVWRLDAETLRVEWKCALPDTVLGSVAIADDFLYCGARDGKLYMLSPEGKIVGSYSAGSPLLASPAVAEKQVFIVSVNGSLIALDRLSLTPLWEMTASAQPMCLSSPVVARGHVFVGTQTDGLLCLGEPANDETELPQAEWPGYLGGAGQGGCLDDSPLPQTPKIRWQISQTSTKPTIGNSPSRSDGPLESAGRQDWIPSPAAVAGQRLVATISNERGAGIECFDLAKMVGEKPQLVWRRDTPSGAYSSAAMAGKNVLFTTGRRGSENRALECLDRETGQLRWQLPIAVQASGALVCTATCALVQLAENELACISLENAPSSSDATPRIVWRSGVGEIVRVPTMANGMVVVAQVDPPKLRAFDAETGQRLGTYSLDASPTTSVVVVKRFAYVGTQRGVARVALAGEPNSTLVGTAPLGPWQRGNESVASEIVFLPRRLAYSSTKGEAIVISLETGQVERRTDGVSPHAPPLISREAVLLVTPDGLLSWKIDQVDSEPELWIEAPRAGAIFSPLVLNGSVVYFSDSQGLIAVGSAP